MVIKKINKFFINLNIENFKNGIIKPLSDLPIEITFTPKIERSYNYNIECQIKRKTRNLHVNVKGIGYILHHHVYLGENQIALNPAEN